MSESTVPSDSLSRANTHAHIFGTRRPDNEMPVETRHTAQLSRSDSDGSSTEAAEPESSTISLDELGTSGVLSLSSISLEAYILGITLGAAAVLSIYFVFLHPTRLWRTALFVSTLSIFHFLEFYTTARWNHRIIKADSYLTTSNGRPYILAMSFALLETTLTSIFFESWQAFWARNWLQLIGLLLLLSGQMIRSGAMATAGASFNHKVQHRRKSDHVLITWGLYAWLRHPSYFGFYWWAVGTQILLGNAISTPLFALILWNFFYRRIPWEEKSLIQMFGDDYIQHRKKTAIGIPFMATAVNAFLKRKTGLVSN